MAHKSRYGAGSIRKRDKGRWELRVLAGQDPVTDKHRYVSRCVRGAIREAEAVMAALLVEVSQGGGWQGTDATMGHLIEQGLDLRKDSLSVATYEGYLGKVRFRILPALGAIAVQKLTARDIDAFYRATSPDARLALSTVKQMHNVLVGSLDQADTVTIETPKQAEGKLGSILDREHHRLLQQRLDRIRHEPSVSLEGKLGRSAPRLPPTFPGALTLAGRHEWAWDRDRCPCIPCSVPVRRRTFLHSKLGEDVLGAFGKGLAMP